ncbi:hypothetical protein PSTT_04549 [Puccinia striiformis]|uniref:Uncharacterized protein n=1 Tax=Puccinia striiformis TaxID=27350 RepID=A0A2S4VS30_9BASI|nr:hypothetical protein PSTT_04549 [Puccinia striiformis]
MWRNTVKAIFGDYPVRQPYTDQRLSPIGMCVKSLDILGVSLIQMVDSNSLLPHNLVTKYGLNGEVAAACVRETFSSIIQPVEDPADLSPDDHLRTLGFILRGVVGILCADPVRLGRTSKQETILLAHPKNGLDSQGQETQCMAASINVCDDIYTVQPVSQIRTSTPSSDDVGLSVVPGPFRWTVWSVVPTPNKQPAAYSSLSNLGFRYMEESLSCNITTARFTYYLKPRPKIKSKYKHKHHDFDSSTSRYGRSLPLTLHVPLRYLIVVLVLSSVPAFALEFYSRLERFVFSSARQLAFQEFDLDKVQSVKPSDSPKKLKSEDITQVEISLKGVTFVPSARFTFDTYTSLENYRMKGSLHMGNGSEPIDPLSSFLSNQFIDNTSFMITFGADVEVRPILTRSNIRRMPTALSLLFHQQFETLSWLVDAAGSDLHNRSFGVSYTCTRTTKPWKRPLPLLSSTVVNSAGAFSFGMWLIVLIACKFDQRHSRAKTPPPENRDFDDEQNNGSQVSKVLGRQSESKDQ